MRRVESLSFFKENHFLRVVKFFTLCFILFLSASCSEQKKKTDFIYINGPEPQSLDPAIVTGQVEGRLCKALFEGLTTRDAKGMIVPGMAHSWNISPDGLRYIFHLRKEAKWSDGSILTAHDFEASWRRALEPSTASRYAELFFFIRNAENYQKGRLKDFSQVGIHAPDEHTLEVELNAPTPFFLDIVSFVTYLPVHLPTVKKYGKDWIKPGKIVCNGPYQLRNWRIHDRLELEKNQQYWRRESVAFERVDALTVANASTAFNLYATGESDLLLDRAHAPAILMQELKKRSDFHANPFLATYFYRFNVTRPPFNDARVRQAFALAVDKERIVAKLTKAGEPIANSFVPPGIPGYEPAHGLSYNPQRARELLVEAGFTEGENFPRVSLLYNKTDLNEQIATEIQAMWKETLGVSVELKNQEWATYLKSLDNLDFDIARSSWIGDYNDPNTFLDCFVSGRGNNRTGWSHSEYDKLLEQASREPNAKQRLALLRQAEEILIAKELPIVPLYFFVGIVFYDPERLGGMFPNVVDEHPLRELFWKEKP